MWMASVVLGCGLVAAPVLAAGAAAGVAPATCGTRTATIVGTDGPDHLVGTEGPDIISAGRGADTIIGLGGDDILCGGRGEDVLDGGEGDDRLHGGHDYVFADQGGPGIRGDLLHGGPGDDYLDAGFYENADTGNFPNTLSFHDAPGPVTVRLRGAEWLAEGDGVDTIVPTRRLSVIGSPFGDQVIGSDRDEMVVAGLGDDRVRTRGGDDVVFAETEEATPDAGDHDRVLVGPGNDQVTTYDGTALIQGNGGDDILFSLSDDPVSISGGSGTDQVNAQVPHTPGQVLDGGGQRGDTLVLTAWTAEQGGTPDQEIELRRPRRSLVSSGEGYEVRSVVSTFARFLLEGEAHWTFFGADVREEVVGVSAGRLHAWLRGGRDEAWASAGFDVLRGGGGTDSVHAVEPGDDCRGFEVGPC